MLVFIKVHRSIIFLSIIAFCNCHLKHKYKDFTDHITPSVTNLSHEYKELLINHTSRNNHLPYKYKYFIDHTIAFNSPTPTPSNCKKKTCSEPTEQQNAKWLIFLRSHILELKKNCFKLVI